MWAREWTLQGGALVAAGEGQGEGAGGGDILQHSFQRHCVGEGFGRLVPPDVISRCALMLTKIYNYI